MEQIMGGVVRFGRRARGRRLASGCGRRTSRALSQRGVGSRKSVAAMTFQRDAQVIDQRCVEYLRKV